jgi:two-component system, OmpR family, response regulator MprA
MRGSKTVLVVDDDPGVRMVVRWALADEGYQVIEAENGHEALSTVEQAPPDAIVLDLAMPVMDGRAFIAECQRRTHLEDVPIVVMSADSQSICASLPGAADVLAKPFDIDALVTRIGSLMERSRPGG